MISLEGVAERLRRWSEHSAVVRMVEHDAGPGRTSPHWVGRLAATWLDVFRQNNLLTYASAIALQLLIALVPVALLALLLLGDAAPDVWREDVMPEVRERFSSSTANALDTTVEGILSNTGQGLVVFASLLLVWEISGAVRAVMGALNRIYDRDETRPLVTRFGLSFVLATCVGGCVIAAVLLFSIGPRLLSGALATAAGVLRWPAVVLLLLLAIGLLIRYAPAPGRPSGGKASPGWASFGAVLVVVLWLLGSLGFGFYVENVASFTSAVGSLTLVLELGRLRPARDDRARASCRPRAVIRLIQARRTKELHDGIGAEGGSEPKGVSPRRWELHVSTNDERSPPATPSSRPTRRLRRARSAGRYREPDRLLHPRVGE